MSTAKAAFAPATLGQHRWCTPAMKYALKAAGWTQEDVADEMGIDRRTVMRQLNRAGRMDADLPLVVAELTGRDIREFITAGNEWADKLMPTSANAVSIDEAARLACVSTPSLCEAIHGSRPDSARLAAHMDEQGRWTVRRADLARWMEEHR